MGQNAESVGYRKWLTPTCWVTHLKDLPLMIKPCWKWAVHNSHLLLQQTQPLLLGIFHDLKENPEEQSKRVDISSVFPGRWMGAFSRAARRSGGFAGGALAVLSGRGVQERVLFGWLWPFPSFSRAPEPTGDTLKSPSTHWFILGSLGRNPVLHSTA